MFVVSRPASRRVDALTAPRHEHRHPSIHEGPTSSHDGPTDTNLGARAERIPFNRQELTAVEKNDVRPNDRTPVQRRERTWVGRCPRTGRHKPRPEHGPKINVWDLTCALPNPTKDPLRKNRRGKPQSRLPKDPVMVAVSRTSQSSLDAGGPDGPARGLQLVQILRKVCHPVQFDLAKVKLPQLAFHLTSDLRLKHSA